MLTTRIATVFESLERQLKLARQHNSCWFPIQHDYAYHMHVHIPTDDVLDTLWLTTFLAATNTL